MDIVMWEKLRNQTDLKISGLPLTIPKTSHLFYFLVRTALHTVSFLFFLVSLEVVTVCIQLFSV